MYICLCNAITDRDIVKAAEQGVCSSEDHLAPQLGVGLGCGRCTSCAKSILSETLARLGRAPAASPG
jgi:bacterioferritin-associated ferredoxin